MQVSTTRLMDPSRESSRRSCLLRNQRIPSRQPWLPTAPTWLGKPRARHSRRGPGPAHPPQNPTPAAPPEGLRPCPPRPALTPPEPSSIRRYPDFPQTGPASVLSTQSSDPRPRASPHCPPLPVVEGLRDLSGPGAQQTRGTAHRASHRHRASSTAAAKLSHSGPGPAPSPAAGNRKRAQGPAPPPSKAGRRRLRPRPLSTPPPRAEAPTPRTGKEEALRACREVGRGLGGNTEAASLALAVLPHLCGPWRGRDPTVGQERGGAPCAWAPPSAPPPPPPFPPTLPWGGVGGWGF